MAASETQTATRTRQIAALDLGSNSFHLLLVVPLGRHFRTVERLKERVQLLAGCRDGMITADAFMRGLACIGRFRQRLSGLEPVDIYVMGTHALRQAKNAEAFLSEVNGLLGREVQVISGEQEAELVYEAVNRGTVIPERLRTVIDVGGGSTEIAFGDTKLARTTQSLDIGCVGLTDKYFKSGDRQPAAYLAVKDEVIRRIVALRDSDPRIRESIGAGAVIGTSGTIESIQVVLKANGWIKHAITREGMARLETAIIEEQWFVEGGLPGLAPDRVDIFPAGAAIVSGCFAGFNLEEMAYARVSLLHGMIFKALQRQTEAAPGKIAEQSIADLMQNFDVDPQQANRVRQQCSRLYQATTEHWVDDTASEALLGWAADLHELGMQVNASHYHRHGAYIIKHAQLPGFSEAQQHMLSLLVRGHRRGLPSLAFKAFDPEMALRLTQLVALLRISVILERSHDARESPEFQAACTKNALSLEFEANWLAGHPLSARELVIEAAQLEEAGIEMSFVDA
ncbi:MAG: Ppx/GppA phosphatase family protein [Pseudomonadota bacterium]|nr:Ppx/GppA phosphatase family protein [Pseudomonadota bacterium]